MSNTSKYKDKKDRTEETENEKGEDAVSITDDVRGADYYHGLIPKADAEPTLKKEGDFLLRKTEHNGKVVLAMSVRVSEGDKGGVKNFMVNQDTDGRFYFENQKEKSVGDLIAWHL